MRNKIHLAAIVLAVTLSVPRAGAMTSPVGVSLMPPLEFPFPSGTVNGVRLNLLRGTHDSVYGLDLGSLFCETRKDFVGVQFCGFQNANAGRATIIGLQFAFVTNSNRGADTNIYGLQLALLGNINHGKGTMVGAGISAFLNSSDLTVIGAQLAFANHAEYLYGFQIGIFNDVGARMGGKMTTMGGVQFGVFNFADDVYGFQVGLCNFAHTLHGVQIGLLNFNKTGPLAFFPFFNAGF